MKAKTPRPNLLSLINELLYPIPSEYPPFPPRACTPSMYAYFAAMRLLRDGNLSWRRQDGERKSETGADFNW